MQTPEIGAPSSPLVSTLLSGKAPRALKASAARGVLPMLRAELMKILVVLAADADEEIRREAASRLGSFSEDELRPMLEDPAAPPEVLDHFGADPRCSPALVEALVANPATPVATLRTMIPRLDAAQVDLMLLNQTRIIAHPELVDIIESSDLALSPLQRSRLVEIRRHFLRAPAGTAPPVSAAPATAVPLPEPAAPAPQPDEPAVAAPAVPAEPADETVEADAATQAVVVANAMQKILRLNTAEKVQLAFKGTREERSILIKDSSKLVQEAVLESPKLTENEVEAIARMRTIGEDVLRIIAGNRDWIKNYSIIHSLTANPKTPAGIALHLVNRLTSHDLKLLCTDKNVPELIRRQARKITDSRNQRPGRH